MANAIFCNDGVTTENVDFSGQSIQLGSFITAVEEFLSDPLDNINYCLEITSTGQTGPFILTATTSAFTSCYDCLVQNNTVVSFTDCVTSSGYTIDLSQLGYIPIVGSVFNMTITNVSGRTSGTFSGCFYITEILQYSTNNYNNLILDLFTIDELLFSNYSTCEECLNGFSAGTEYTSCTICCPCGTGTTVSTVSTPHPVWSNFQGQPIILLDAVQLGGMNGLNS
jgi:hypothetical protein